MAIAFDSASWVVSWAPVTTQTWSHTCSGTDRILMVQTASNAWQINSVTYNSIALTKIADIAHTGFWFVWLWYLIEPSSWANTVSVTWAGSTFYVCNSSSYTWVSWVSPINVSWSVNGSASAYTSTLTSTIDKCWHIAGMRFSWATLTAWGGTTLRSSVWGNATIADWNWQITPAWSNTLTINGSSLTDYWLVWAIIKPKTTATAWFFSFF